MKRIFVNNSSFLVIIILELYNLFSSKSDSTITNVCLFVCLSICQSPKPISLFESCLSAIMPISWSLRCFSWSHRSLQLLIYRRSLRYFIWSHRSLQSLIYWISQTWHLTYKYLSSLIMNDHVIFSVMKATLEIALSVRSSVMVF